MQKVSLTILWPDERLGMVSQENLIKAGMRCLKEQPDEILNLPSISISDGVIQVKINPLNDEQI
jgi:hypothetical protein